MKLEGEDEEDLFSYKERRKNLRTEYQHNSLITNFVYTCPMATLINFTLVVSFHGHSLR